MPIPYENHPDQQDPAQHPHEAPVSGDTSEGNIPYHIALSNLSHSDIKGDNAKAGDHVADGDDPRPDYELAYRYQQGDEQCFAILWNRHEDYLTSYAKGQAKHLDLLDAEDMVHEITYTLIKRLQDTGDNGPFFDKTPDAMRHYIAKAIKFKIYDYEKSADFRRTDRLREQSERPESTMRWQDIEHTSFGVSVEDAVERLESNRHLSLWLGILATSKPRQAQILTLRYIGERSNEEVAEIMNMTIGAAKTLRIRALGSMRRIAVTHPDPRAHIDQKKATGYPLESDM